MKFHTLKCWPPYFQEVRDDLKGLEIRQNDRDYQEGDLLILQEYLPNEGELAGYESPALAGSFDVSRTREAIADLVEMERGYTGDVELALARHVLREAPGLAPGYVAITLQRVVLAAPDIGEDGPGPH